MKRKFLSITLSVFLILALFPLSAFASFTDMPAKDHWSYKALAAAVENGLLLGGDGRLMPQDSLTRAQLAAILVRALGATEVADVGKYTDLRTSAWYFSEVAKAVRMRLLQGDGGTIRPDAPVTREEAFTILARAFKLPDDDTAALSGFSDRGSVSVWAAPALAALVKAGYVHGSGNLLNPSAPITRAEFAAVMYNMVSVYLSKAGTYTQSITGNMVVSAPGVVLKGFVISGDLIIGEGVGSGDITLDKVTVGGRLIVRGGGENSIHIINGSDVGSIVIGKTGDGGIRIKAEEGCRVNLVYVDDGIDTVILEGTFNAVTIAAAVPTTLLNASVTTLSLAAEGAAVALSGSSTVTQATIAEAARGAGVTVGDGSKIAHVESAAPSVTIQGTGTVTEAVISGHNTAVNTKNTKITVSEGTTGVTENGSTVKPGSGNTGGTGTGGGNSGDTGGGPSSGAATVSTADAFTAAANNSAVTSITVTGTVTLEKDITLTKAVTVAAGAVLTVNSAWFSGTLTNNGTIVTAGSDRDGVVGKLYLYSDKATAADAGKLVNNGTFINNGNTVVVAPCSAVNRGVFENRGTLEYVDELGLKGADHTVTAIAGVTGNGWVACTAQIHTATALHTAMEKTAEGGGAYYDRIYVAGDNGAVTAARNVAVCSGQMLVIGEDTTLVVPSALGLTVASGGELHVGGTVTVTGTASNSGRVVREPGGTIAGAGAPGGIIPATGGKQYNGYLVTDEAAWAEALADPYCFIAEVSGDVEIHSNVTVGFPVTVDEGVTLTIGSGTTLTVEAGSDDFIGGAYMIVRGTLVNGGILDIRPNSGVFPDEGGTLTSSGVINVRGGLGADASNLGGTVNFYANAADIARQLWQQLDGLLPAGVDETTDYAAYSNILSRLDQSDTTAKYALAWLFKNGVLTPDADFDPYTFVGDDAINTLLDQFASEAGLTNTVSIHSDGVVTSDGTETQGSSLDQLINTFVEGLNVSSVNADTEAQLRAYQTYTYIRNIHVTADINLGDSLSVTKTVVIDPGRTLTVAAGKNLTIDWREWNQNQIGYEGALAIDGTLAVPDGSQVINKGTVILTGALENNGAFTNLREQDAYGSRFVGTGGTIGNAGVFVSNGEMTLTGTALVSGGSFTNNGDLTITSGSVTSTAPFHNAGHMKICDAYGSDNLVTALHFNNTLTNNSNWIEYTACVYSEDGLDAAQAEQTAKIAANGGSRQSATGLDVYTRMDVLTDITLTGSVTLSGWDVWVEADDSGAAVVPYTLTIGNTGALTLVDSTLNVDGVLRNEGTLTLGTASGWGTIQVWPTGAFENENSGTVSGAPDGVWRMDEYKNDGSATLFRVATVTGCSYNDIAIVHDWAGLHDAAVTKSNVYERIDILGGNGNDCDITLGSDLTINAEVYIEWGNGIEIPAGKTLTLTGTHWLNTNGDIWVYGQLNVGPGVEINNNQYIQIDGTVVNDGIINNNNNITLMSGGTLAGSGVVCGVPGGLTNNSGTLTCAYYRLAWELHELKNALHDGVPVLWAGDVDLTEDLTLSGDVAVGWPGHWGGAIRTGANTLIIDDHATLTFNNGELEIGDGGAVENNGSMTFGQDGRMHILSGGMLTTESAIYVYGWMHLYDWEHQHDYITGDVYAFANTVDLLQCLYRLLYRVDETGCPTGVQDGVTGAADPGSFDAPSELEDIGGHLANWSDLSGDPYSQYTCAVLYENGVIGDRIIPYTKLTYGEAKLLMTALAGVFGAADDEVAAFFAAYDSTHNAEDFICTTNFSNDPATGHPSDFDALVDSFSGALPEALVRSGD